MAVTAEITEAQQRNDLRAKEEGARLAQLRAEGQRIIDNTNPADIPLKINVDAGSWVLCEVTVDLDAVLKAFCDKRGDGLKPYDVRIRVRVHQGKPEHVWVPLEEWTRNVTVVEEDFDDVLVREMQDFVRSGVTVEQRKWFGNLDSNSYHSDSYEFSFRAPAAHAVEATELCRAHLQATIRTLWGWAWATHDAKDQENAEDEDRCQVHNSLQEDAKNRPYGIYLEGMRGNSGNNLWQNGPGPNPRNSRRLLGKFDWFHEGQKDRTAHLKDDPMMAPGLIRVVPLIGDESNNFCVVQNPEEGDPYSEGKILFRSNGRAGCDAFLEKK